MDILLLLGFLVVFALLCGSGWLLWHILRQQGRLLLRIEAFEAHLTSAGRAPFGDRAGESVTGTVPLAAAASDNQSTGAPAMPGPPASPSIGDAAPDFSLPDLSGTLVRLSDFRGRQTLVLFWSPRCDFCRRMLPFLRAWEAQPPEGAPTLVVVSTGSVQDNQAMGLRSPVVLEQEDRSIGKMLDATGTPTAVLVDAEGRIASEPTAGAPAILALARPQPTKAEESIELTIGMATYHDFDGVYFTLQALRLYQDLEHTELLVIDNYGCEETKNLVEGWLGARYIRATDAVGTAAPRDMIFREARGKAVLCCDCHILFAPGAIAQLKQYYREHPSSLDLLQGPLLYDDGKLISTHFEPVWREQMWGTWGCDPRGLDPSGEPFEIPMQGLGVFSCRKSAWLGFHPAFRGFGGEEGYIHEKFRQAGRRCLCLPWLRWMHRFGRPAGIKYPLIVEDKLRNYVLGHAELGLDLAPVVQHFSVHLPQDRVLAIAEEALAGQRGRTALNGTARPLVSVVLPVYNGERYIRAAVQSLLRQTLQQIEIIVINDGSTDHTEQILGELAVDPRVRLVHQSHQGDPQARNRGITLAKAEYIAVHDADDISLPDRLAKQQTFLEQFPDFGLVGSFADVIDDTGQIIGGFGGVLTDPAQIPVQLLTSNCLVHGSVMMRKSALEAVGKYREAFALANDYDLWLRMTEQVQLGNIAQVLYLYRRHADSISQTKGTLLRTYAGIALELAYERRQTGSDLLEREGSAAFLNTYRTQLQVADLPEEFLSDRERSLRV